MVKKTKAEVVTIGRRVIDLSNQDKILFGSSGITKGDLVAYYKYVAEYMIPHTKKRPIVLQRFPEGIHKEGFFQKAAASYFPDWITRFSVEHSESSVDYVVLDNAATLVYLANQGCITFHTWLSKIDAINKPDRIIFDLDPSQHSTFTDVQYAAKKIKQYLEAINLAHFCMTTGSRGVHIVIPLQRRYSFERTRAYARQIAQQVVADNEDRLTIEMSKRKRGKRVFIDWLRNSFGATSVAPYSVRPYENVPVATPITWDELFHKNMHAQKYTIATIAKRLDSVGDIWKDIARHAVVLPVL